MEAIKAGPEGVGVFVLSPAERVLIARALRESGREAVAFARELRRGGANERRAAHFIAVNAAMRKLAAQIECATERFRA